MSSTPDCPFKQINPKQNVCIVLSQPGDEISFLPTLIWLRKHLRNWKEQLFVLSFCAGEEDESGLLKHLRELNELNDIKKEFETEQRELAEGSAEIQPTTSTRPQSSDCHTKAISPINSMTPLAQRYSKKLLLAISKANVATYIEYIKTLLFRNQSKREAFVASLAPYCQNVLLIDRPEFGIYTNWDVPLGSTILREVVNEYNISHLISFSEDNEHHRDIEGRIRLATARVVTEYETNGCSSVNLRGLNSVASSLSLEFVDELPSGSDNFNVNYLSNEYKVYNIGKRHRNSNSSNNSSSKSMTQPGSFDNVTNGSDPLNGPESLISLITKDDAKSVRLSIPRNMKPVVHRKTKLPPSLSKLSFFGSTLYAVCNLLIGSFWSSNGTIRVHLSASPLRSIKMLRQYKQTMKLRQMLKKLLDSDTTWNEIGSD